MKIASVVTTYSNYSKRQTVTQRTFVNQSKKNCSKVLNPSFKSNKGALFGMGVGAILGIGAAALVVATGGLAAAVAAVGATGVGAAGAGIGSIL